jgi:hypothetical protein
LRRAAVSLAFVFALSSGSSCTQSEGEVGVYVVPSQGGGGGSGGGPDAAIMIPPIDADNLPPDVASSRCEPGLFQGSFSCNFALGQSCEQNTGMLGFVMMGTVSLSLVHTGEFLTVSGATLDASAGGYTMSGPLTGLVDCRVKKFGGSVDGIYSGSAIPGIPPISGQLAGPVSATYDPREPALTNGTWCLTATNPGTLRTEPCADIPPGQPLSCIAGSCKGTWSAVRVSGS